MIAARAVPFYGASFKQAKEMLEYARKVGDNYGIMLAMILLQNAPKEEVKK